MGDFDCPVYGIPQLYTICENRHKAVMKDLEDSNGKYVRSHTLIPCIDCKIILEYLLKEV